MSTFRSRTNWLLLPSPFRKATAPRAIPPLRQRCDTLSLLLEAGTPGEGRVSESIGPNFVEK